ncbi:MAG: acyltransferase [Janthinobacterium lividum]
MLTTAIDSDEASHGRRLSPRAWRLRLHVVNRLVMSALVGPRARQQLLRAVGYDVGDARLEHGTVIRCETLSIGDGSFVNHGCFFAAGDIVLGRNVFLAKGVTLSTGDHRLGPHEKRAGEDVQGPIVVEDGCWLGINVVVLRGVRVAAGCVVGAGAVVTKDTEPDGVYVGVPARRIRDLDPGA